MNYYNCVQECGHCHGRIHRHPVAPAATNRWLVLVADERELLAGEVKPSDESLAVRTYQKMMVEVASWYIHHSIPPGSPFDRHR